MASPAQPNNRGSSVGPNGPLPTPTATNPPSINGAVGGNVAGPSMASGGGGGGTGQMTAQNLNQIVIDYLSKKGYTNTERVLRQESANQEVTPHLLEPIAPQPNAVAPKHLEAFKRMRSWAMDSLEIYKPEVTRLLWPFFVYAYLDLVKGKNNQSYAKDAILFFQTFKEQFNKEHEQDLRTLQYITLPEHIDPSLGPQNIGTIYRDNKYRVVLSNGAFNFFMAFIESLPPDSSRPLMGLLQNHLDIRQTDRSADDRFSFATILARAAEDVEEEPMEDEGIPGHRPGNAVSSLDPNIGNHLVLLKLGKLPMDEEVEADVRAELTDLDLKIPPRDGDPEQTFLKTLDAKIKQESDAGEGPSREDIPFPPATARDVVFEVTKIRENRDRVKLEGRTGGVGPQVSCVMYTFHNSGDSVSAMDISKDQKLIACGFMDHTIRVWTLDGSILPNELLDSVQPPQNSHRLIGHSETVYQVAFAPAALPYSDDPVSLSEAPVRWLLSSSGDGTIRLWNLSVFQCMVIYKGHLGPVWDVAWGPFGHYFASGGNDKLGRIWTTDSMQPKRLLAGHERAIEVVTWHPNNAYVFTASSDNTVRMWSLSNGIAARMFTGHTSYITEISCSRDGLKLASADTNGAIFLWDLATGRLIKKMRGHGKGGIWSLDWSVESSVLVSGGADQTVRAWDVTGPPKEAAVGKPGEAGSKPGESGVGGVGAAAGPLGGVNLGGTTGGGAKKGRKDAVVTVDQISAFPTKDSVVRKVFMTDMNLCLSGSVYLPEQKTN